MYPARKLRGRIDEAEIEGMGGKVDKSPTVRELDDVADGIADVDADAASLAPHN